MNRISKNKAVFFDRDGIVNVRLIDDYVKNIDEFQFIPEFFKLFDEVKKAGFFCILISNQQGVGKGIMTNDDLEKIHDYMQSELLRRIGLKFDDIFVCTDLAESDSNRRKPNPGMLFEASEKLNIELKESWMIGDSISDIIAGKKAGTKTILVSDSIRNSGADFVFENLEKVIDFFSNKLKD